MHGLGVDADESMCSRISGFLASGEIAYSTPDGSSSVRKWRKAGEQVAAHCVEAAQPLSRLSSRRGSLRAAHGGRKGGGLALAITEARPRSERTDRRRPPETVAPTGRSSGLYMFCGGFRKARQERASFADARGATIQEPHQFAGQAHFAGQVKAAGQYTRGPPPLFNWGNRYFAIVFFRNRYLVNFGATARPMFLSCAKKCAHNAQ